MCTAAGRLLEGLRHGYEHVSFLLHFNLHPNKKKRHNGTNEGTIVMNTGWRGSMGGRLDRLVSRSRDSMSPRDSDQPRMYHDIRPCSVIFDTGSGNWNYCQVVSL